MREKDELMKVLILEDVPSDAELVKLQFEFLDFDSSFVVTDKEQEYIDLLKSFRPDIVISDFNLPRFDGLKALKILRDKDQVTPFLFVTGSLGEENAVKAIKTGATDFISKNQVHQLPAAITKALRELDEVKAKHAYMHQVVENEKRFKALVQSGSDFIAIVDWEGQFTFCSDNYSKLLGYTLAELEHKSLFSYIHKDDLGRFIGAFKEVEEKEVVIVEPYRFRNAFNQWHWFQCTITNLINEPHVAGIVLNSQDVTPLVKKEMELELSNERYKLASVATQDLIYDWDLETGEVQRDGKVLQKLFGYDPTISQREHFWKDHIHPDDIEEAYADLEHQLQDPRASFCEKKYRFKRADGSYAHLHDKGYVLRDEQGKALRLIGATRDVTAEKNQAILKDLMLDIAQAMSQNTDLTNALKAVLELLCEHSHSAIGEVWLASKNDHKEINLRAQHVSDPETSSFVRDSEMTCIRKGKGLVGKVWESGQVTYWPDLKKSGFLRVEYAMKAGISSGLCIPISHGGRTIGVFLFLMCCKDVEKAPRDMWLNITRQIAPDLQRKQTEEELNNFFSLSADLLCILGFDAFFKKVNHAFPRVLLYPEEELLSKPFYEFVHPEDREITHEVFQSLLNQDSLQYFENRYVTKEGKTKWFSWSVTILKDEGILLAAGHDITERRKLEWLIHQSQTMARIGSWEFDLVQGTLFWTSMTKRIHEVDDDFVPDAKTAINFYKEGKSRETISRCLEMGMKEGTPWDVELQIITAAGYEKWVRAKGEWTCNKKLDN